MLALGLTIGGSIRIEMEGHVIATIRLSAIDKYGHAVIAVEQAGIEWYEVSLGFLDHLALRLGIDTVRIEHAGRSNPDARRFRFDAPEHIRFVRDNAGPRLAGHHPEKIPEGRKAVAS